MHVGLASYPQVVYTGKRPGAVWSLSGMKQSVAPNTRAHGVDFLTIILAFENPLLERVDDREDYGEERLIALGHVEGIVYRIVYTMRNSRVRIISAMKANGDEQEIYYRATFT